MAARRLQSSENRMGRIGWFDRIKRAIGLKARQQSPLEREYILGNEYKILREQPKLGDVVSIDFPEKNRTLSYFGKFVDGNTLIATHLKGSQMIGGNYYYFKLDKPLEIKLFDSKNISLAKLKIQKRKDDK